MKYMLLVYEDEHSLTDAERGPCYEESARLADELNASGKYLGCNPLHPVATATSVRVRGGKPVVTDGPFAETREQLGGYFLIDAKDLDEAIEIAARIPGARRGTDRNPAGRRNIGHAVCPVISESSRFDVDSGDCRSTD